MIEKSTGKNSLSQYYMPEAEVALRLAFFLLDLPNSGNTAQVALDGAQVQVRGNQIFSLTDFLADMGWSQVEQKGKRDWQGRYEKEGKYLEIHSRSGIGDVVVSVGHRRVYAECKKGPLVPKPANPEYKLLREAIGQVITVKQVQDNDIMVVAVPDSPKFRQLASEWREIPLVKRAGIQIVTVARDGAVDGLKMSSLLNKGVD
jgi:hypothetical protein